MNNPPLVSVIVPAYNAAATLALCLESLFQQSCPPLEVILVDDRSQDQTPAIAQSFPCRYVVNQGPQGPAGARNFGARQAQGQILAFTDADVVAPPHWLEKMLQAFADPRVGVVGGGYASGMGQGFFQEYCHLELAFRRKDFPLEVKSLVSNNLGIKKDLFDTLGGFPEQFPVCEDLHLSFQASQQAKVLWLKDNGVKHHFVTHLRGYLRHQYQFGAESTRFFLNHPEMALNNHQGNRLKISILSGFLTVVALVLAGLGMGLTQGGLWWALLPAASWGVHLASHGPWLVWMQQKPLWFRAKAYGVAFLRDAYCGLSILDGLWRYFKKDRGHQPKA